VTGRRCPGCLLELHDPSTAAGFPCGACRRRPPVHDRLLAGWLYEPPLRDVVVALKYQRLEYLGDALGDALAERFAPQLGDCTAVAAVPLHWSRWARRGYNQAGIIARRVARRLELPLRRPLARRWTRSQTGLTRARRRANLARAFVWRGPPLEGAPHWLLVDDVFTTGATLDRAARALRHGGVGEITALVAALTPVADFPRRAE
jgi:ComF family protein